jgi:formylglycine-generating enzyme required for sulfatase activity
MPGLGLETETLAYLKQTLYVTGIGRQVDSGAWEKLEADKRLEGFDHTFLWLREDHLILGQLWSSKDGKGRAKYPMVLCVDCERVAPGLLLNKVRPGLEALRDACKTATAAEQVASNCRVAQEQLRTFFAGSATQSDTHHSGDDPRRFLERAELGPDRLGLLRVLHELGGSFDTSGDTRPATHGAGAPKPSLHLRVPLAADSQNSGLLLWAEFLQSALSSDVSLILMARGGTDWLDIVVGEPKADDFFFLQASQKGFPLVTQIPYELAPNAMARLREIETRFCGAEGPASDATAKAATPAPPPAPVAAKPAPPPAPKAATPPPPPPPKVATPPPPPAPKAVPPAPPAPVPAPKAAPAAPPPAAPRAQQAAPPAKSNTGLIVGSVVVVLIAALVFWLLHGNNGDQKNFDDLVATGKALLGEKKYDEAIHDLQDAAKIHPQDEQVKQILDQAQRERDSGKLANQKDADYQSALKNARESFARGDYADASAQAGKALSIKPADADATHLLDDAQAKQSAIGQARQKEADYQAAITKGRASFAGGDFTTALTAAGEALALKPGDAEATQLSRTSQAKLADLKKEADYQAALKSAREALAHGDFTNALTEAGKALSFKPGDADAKQFRDNAQAKLAELAAATQMEADYQAAMKHGRAALARGDYKDALTHAGEALALKPNDANARQLQDDAKQKLSSVHPQAFTNSIQMEFVWVPGLGGGGAFVGKYEVTERQYQTIMGDLPDGQAPAEGNMPIAGITFPQATKFCEELSKRENKHYSLPTRQQWLAAAGISEDKVTNAWDILSASGALDNQATGLKNPRPTKPVAVGSMGTSTNGLCDILGNVREWDSEQQRAGFSYQSRKGGRTEELFLPGSATDPWIEEETGMRCILQESQTP